MITRNNIQEVMDLVGPEILTESEKNLDYLLIQLNIFNVGATVTVEAQDYSEETDLEAQDSGNLFIDWDTFLQLYKESGSNNPYIDQL
jgi:hypothetical protein